MSVVQTKLNDHDVFWAKQKIQIINENFFDDEHTHSNEILLHLDRVRIDSNMIIFQKMMRRVRITLIHDFWTTMMSNLLIAKSRRNDVIIKSFDLWTFYCRINSFLLIARELTEKEKRFIFAKFLFRRHFLEIDLEICQCHVFAWLF